MVNRNVMVAMNPESGCGFPTGIAGIVQFLSVTPMVGKWEWQSSGGRHSWVTMMRGWRQNKTSMMRRFIFARQLFIDCPRIESLLVGR